MAKLFQIIFILLCFSTLGFAEESPALSQRAIESIQQQTHEMRALGVPESQARKMLTLMVQKTFQKQTRIRARQVIITAAKEGLSTEPIINKAMEGMAKQVREQNIIVAMEAVYRRHAHANQLARSLSNDKENIEIMTQTIADSMAAGMKSTDIKSVVARLQVRTLQQTRNRSENDNLAIQTMKTVCTMARLGVESSIVSDILRNALQNQYSPQEIKQLRQLLTQKANIISPRQVANQYASSIGKAGKTGGSDGSSNGGSSSKGSGGGNGSNGGSGSGGGGSGGSGGSGGGGGGSGGK